MTSIPSRLARCTSDASASCILKPSYLARTAAMPGRSASPRGTSSKGRPWKDDRSFRIAPGYARKSHAASVITGQHVRSGPLIRRSCSTHAPWCSSDSDRMAYLAAQGAPNPSKCLGFVLRSRTAPCTAPISPAFFAYSYALRESSPAASCRSTAPRTRSDSRVPLRRAAAFSRRRNSAGNRTVIR